MSGSRIGVYGGTFDPLHNGHWRVAQAVLDAFAFDRLLFVPAFVPPHKRGRKISAPYHRYAMLALATANEERMFVSPIEIEAPTRPYTIETLGRLAGQSPGARLFFLMGADSFAEVTMWREYQRVLGEYSVIVAGRPGVAGETDWTAGSDPAGHLSPELRARVRDLRGGARPSGEMFDMPGIFLTDYVAEDVSATDIREASAAGRRIDDLTPPEIAAYIAKYGLYK